MSIPRAVIADQGSKTVSDALRNVSNVNEVDPRESNNVGCKATSYWDTRDVLKEIGAIPTRGRIVVDRNRITDGGVTAGIDFGLKLVALLKSRVYAEAVQLYLEYDPQPPFNAGSPEKAQPLARQFLKDMFAGMRANALATAQAGDAETAERANLRWSPHVNCSQRKSHGLFDPIAACLRFICCQALHPQHRAHAPWFGLVSTLE